MKIAVIGSGYVGLVTGTCLAEVGHEIICVDHDPLKLERLKAGICPIFEPALEDYMKRNISHERLIFSDNLAKAVQTSALVFIAVGTPEKEDGSADLSSVMAVAGAVAEHADHDFMLVVKSTVPVGTCDAIQSKIEEVLAKRISGKKIPSIKVASNPEFLREGSAVEDFMHPERIIIGIKNPADRSLFEELYQPFIADDPARLILMDRRSSELTKYGANTMLASRITMMNELAILCDKVGANIDEIRRGMGSDSRIGKRFLHAGPGFGGSCFPKDVEALIKTSEQYGFDFKTLKATKEANHRQKLYALEKVSHWINKHQLSGGKIALWGLAFKPGTDDVRESPSLLMVQQLLTQTNCTIYAYDPRGIENFAKQVGEQQRLKYVGDAYLCLEDAHAVLLVTDWPEFKKPNWEKVRKLMHQKHAAIFDFRNQYSFEKLASLGFHYECIGRPDARSCDRLGLQEV